MAESVKNFIENYHSSKKKDLKIESLGIFILCHSNSNRGYVISSRQNARTLAKSRQFAETPKFDWICLQIDLVKKFAGSISFGIGNFL